ncbi:MAG: amidohydrolase family protein, partial [Gemmatimonadetes bacterium]|nr:amidohydrolase family protein [Gemmatimonadota bacterium]
MILLAGADLVLPGRILSGGSLILDADRIVAIEPRRVDPPQGATSLDVPGCTIVPGFVDVHVHGIEGHDVLDGAGAIGEVAARLPRYGVTSFCPTSIACAPRALARMLDEVTALSGPGRNRARVLPAHLESNFISPAYNGAQPVECLRIPATRSLSTTDQARHRDDFTASDIVATIRDKREAVAIVTVAPELDGGLDLVRDLARAGHCVSIGHSGATYEQTLDAIDAGICHATHLFNRMSAMAHRAPGVAGAVLQSDRVRVELICDGFHVHPALMALVMRGKGPSGVMAITDGTAGSGLPVGARAR